SLVLSSFSHIDLLLFLQSYHDHPHLHSFPTRRSSDLDCSAGAKSAPNRHNPRRIQSLFRRFIHLRSDCSAASTAMPSNNSACSRDRKSTRLNSSHVSISYAVFCLKKKKYI